MPRPVTRTLPSADWFCTAILDAKAGDEPEEARCELCGTRLRWVHVLEHHKYHRPLEVGCCCAVRLSVDYDAAGAEWELKNRAGRQQRFLDGRKWKRSKRNPHNFWRKVRTSEHGDVTVTVFRDSGGWFSVYFAAGKDDRYCDGKKHKTRNAAKERAFELVETLRLP